MAKTSHKTESNKREKFCGAQVPDQESVRILIVDDDTAILELLKRAMEMAKINCDVANNGIDALAIMAQTPIDVVITDINMPEMTGIELTAKIFERFSADVIVITGHTRGYQYDQIINIGASDFVEKPFSIQEIILRVKRVLRERRLKADTQKSHQELKQAYIDSIHRLVMASEFKDEDTGDHIARIGEYAAIMAEKLGQDPEFIETIEYAAPMHDVGKIGIPDKILLKPGKLTAQEFEIIKSHTRIGAKLLSDSKSRILQMAEEIALNHHEKFNGTGYPNGLSGTDIPLTGRIVAIADTFDALTSKRPYKEPYPPEMVFDIIRREKGEHFDPQIAEIFLDHFDIFMKVREKFGKFPRITLMDFHLSERDTTDLKT